MSELSNSHEVSHAKDLMEKMIDEWLGSPSLTDKPPEYPPTLDLEAYPWKTYHSKQPCEPGDAGWILGPKARNPTPGIEPLVQLLEQHDGTVVLPPYELSFSQDHTFIQRKPLKESAR